MIERQDDDNGTSWEVRPWPCELLSDDEDDENDKEKDENTENLYHQPSIGRHRLEILDELGVRCLYAHVRIVHICINSAFHTQMKITVLYLHVFQPGYFRKLVNSYSNFCTKTAEIQKNTAGFLVVCTKMKNLQNMCDVYKGAKRSTTEVSLMLHIL